MPFSNRADLLALLDHLNIERTHLVGNSRGGTIALDFTLEHPERVSSLVTVGSTPGGFDLDTPEMAPMWERMETLETAKDWPALVDMEVRLWTDGFGQSPGRVDPSVRERMIRWGLENYIAEGGNGQPQPLDPPAVGRLGEVTVPALVIWGDLDEAACVAAGPLMTNGIRGARAHVFPGVAHMVNLERPTEFAQIVLAFVAEVDAAS